MDFSSGTECSVLVSHLFGPLVHSWPLRTVIKVEQYVLTAARLQRRETTIGEETASVMVWIAKVTAR